MIEHAYQLFCRERFPLPTEQQVRSLEQRIGVVLPDDYREYILTYNGGFFTEPDIIASPKEGCPLDHLESMSGIGASHSIAELGSHHDLTLFDDNAPPQILIVGRGLMGGLILLVTHPEGRGQIVYKQASGGSYFYAYNIWEFFELLRVPQD